MSVQLCPFCDGPLPIDAQFCSDCGNPVKNTNSTIDLNPIREQDAPITSKLQQRYDQMEDNPQQQPYNPYAGMPAQNITIVINTVVQSSAIVESAVTPEPVVAVKQKSMRFALLLALILGPIGLSYANPRAGLVLTVMVLIALWAFGSPFWPLFWIVSFMMAPFGVSRYNTISLLASR